MSFDSKTVKEPHYLGLMASIREYVADAGLKIGDALPSEREFSEMFKIGRPTVNKALACLLNEGRLRREGYKLFLTNSRVHVETSLSIGVLCPHPFHQNKLVSHNLVEAANDICEPRKITFIPKLALDGGQQLDQLSDLTAEKVAGLVIWPFSGVNYEHVLKIWRSRKIPIVCNGLRISGYDFVGVDNTRGIDELVRRLHEIGHREIAYFSIRSPEPDFKSRIEAFQHAAFRQLSIKSRDRIYELDSSSPEDVAEALNTLVRIDSEVTAICCSNDVLALAVLSAAGEFGIRIPQDLSLTGFDGIDASFRSIPPLTTVTQDFYSMGLLAVELLLRRVQMRHLDNQFGVQDIHVTPKFLVGASTFPARSFECTLKKKSTKK